MNKFDFMVFSQLSEEFDCSVYWKDTEGLYQGQNNFANQVLHVNGFSVDVVGKMDNDLFSKSVADKYHYHDKSVIKTREQKMFLETQVNPDGQKIIQLSIKKPLIDNQSEVQGVLGFSYHFSELQCSYGKAYLSKRELDCLAFMYCGNTMKQTANQLSIAPKTVESHVESIKNKLGCQTKCEVIAIVNANGLGKAFQYYHQFLNKGRNIIQE